MITLLLLFMILAVIMILSVLVILATGAIGIVLFGDLIVAVIVIVWLIKKIVRKKK